MRLRVSLEGSAARLRFRTVDGSRFETDGAAVEIARSSLGCRSVSALSAGRGSDEHNRVIKAR